jgi:3-oxoacyl-[acyl-carrier protein] reductase
MGAQNRVAIVTGASKGIGREITFALVQQGFHVLAVARSTHLLNKLVQETVSLPGKLIIAHADVTRRDEVDAAVKKALEYLGHIDVLVNNAGVELVKPVETVSDDEYAATMDTNLKELFHFTRAVVPHMKIQGSGLIINISSTAGQRGFAEDAIYCASKFGVVGFSDALDEELRKFGIRICCISPGAVNTDLAKDTWSPLSDPYRPHYLQPQDVARVVLFVVDQPDHVAIESIILRSMVEPPYSPPLPLVGKLNKKNKKH